MKLILLVTTLNITITKMTNFTSIGKILISIGFFIIVLGIGITLLRKIGFGNLPGDIIMKKQNFTFYFPIFSSIIISLILTLVLNLFLRR